MRGTIHLVTTKDALGLRLLFQPFLERGFFHGSPGVAWPGTLTLKLCSTRAARSWRTPPHGGGACQAAGAQVSRSRRGRSRLWSASYAADGLRDASRHLARKWSGHPDDSRSLARPLGPSGRNTRGPSAALPLRLRSGVRRRHARLVGPRDAPGLRKAPAAAGHLPRRARDRAVRPPGVDPARRRTPPSRSVCCRTTTTSCSVTRTARGSWRRGSTSACSAATGS